MGDRKLRAVLLFAFFTGLLLTALLFLLYALRLPPNLLLGVFIVVSVIEVSFAAIIFRFIYESRLSDLPKGLIRRAPLPSLPGLDLNDPRYDVILLRPPSAVLSGPDCGEALGIGYLASVLRAAGKKVFILDARLLYFDMMQTVELLQRLDAPILGINLNFQYLAPIVEKIIKALRDRGYPAHITLGGLYASMASEKIMESMPGVDTIVRFEGENSLVELIEKLDRPNSWAEIKGLVYREQNEVKQNNLRPLISDLDSIPFPARDYLQRVKELNGYAYIISSRGCNGYCAYCVQQMAVSNPHGSRWRGRSAQSIIQEIEAIVEASDIRKFSFVDDDMFGVGVSKHTHIEALADALIDKAFGLSILLSVQPRDVEREIFSKLKKAGVDSVILAVDNFSQPVLNRYHKNTTVAQNLKSLEVLKKLGIDAYLGIIMFDPWTTIPELLENFSVMQTIPYLRPWQILSKLEIYHGSPITKKLEKEKLIKWDGYFAQYEFAEPGIKPIYEAIETIMKIVHPAMSAFDRYRWGNLVYDEVDQALLNHHNDELQALSSELNRQVVELAYRIVQKQDITEAVLSAEALLRPDFRREAERINQQTLYQLKKLRDMTKMEGQNG